MSRITTHNFTAWDIPEVNEVHKYTILNPSHTYFGETFDAKSLSLLKSASPEKSYAELVHYRPERLLLHECTIQVITQLQLDDENHMHKTVSELYEKIIEEHRVMLEKLPSMQLDNDSLKPDARLKDETLRHETAIHKARQELIREKLKEIVGLAINTLCANSSTHLLPIPNKDDRRTWLIAGGISSGKGTTAWKVKKEAEALGIKYSSLIKINGDSLKPLLLTPGSVPAAEYSQLCVDEATFIKAQIFKRLRALALEGKAPHTLIDETGLKETAINYATVNGGLMKVFIVSTEVSTAVERSFTRGTKDGKKGRYEHTKNILKNHKTVAEGILKFLSELKAGKISNIELEFVDNNVAEGQDPKTFCTISLCTNEITIYNKDQFAEFFKKIYINTEAKSPTSVYSQSIPTELNQKIGELLSTLEANGYVITLTNQPITTHTF